MQKHGTLNKMVRPQLESNGYFYSYISRDTLALVAIQRRFTELIPRWRDSWCRIFEQVGSMVIRV